MRAVADRLGLTEGQAYTLAIGLVFGLVTAMIGIPPTLRDQAARSFADTVAAAAETAPVRSPGPADAAPVADPPSPSGGQPSPMASPPATFEPAPTGVAPPSSSFDQSASSAASSPAYDDGGATGSVNAVASVNGAPRGIAVDSETGAFYVATDRVLRHRPDGTFDRTITVPGDRPLAGLALGTDGALVALAGADVLRIDVRSGSVEDVATIPDVPPCTTDPAGRCETGPRDNAPAPRAVAFDPGGRIVVADAAQGIVWRISGDAPTPWVRGPELVSPQGTGPSGVAFERDGSLLVSVGTSVAALTGAVYRVAVAPDGSAGGLTQVWRSDPNQAPAGVAVTSSGRIVVGLAAADTVVVLDREGTVVARATSGLGRPGALGARGRSVLVANETARTVTRVVAD